MAFSLPTVLEKPHLLDVRVWYYPPQGSPINVVWWEPGQLRVWRKARFSQSGKFRVRVEVAGGFEKAGEKLNFLGVVFRDQNSVTYSLPLQQAVTRGGIKDVYWEPPVHLSPGSLDFQVLAWTGTLPRLTKLTKISDRTQFFMLGQFEPTLANNKKGAETGAVHLPPRAIWAVAEPLRRLRR